MDMWTSNQTIGYMCITCHFLDDDWKMNKRIVKFCFMKTPHTGVAMFNEVLKFIQEWNIEDKIFAITLDNASNNNAMVRLLRSNPIEKHMLCGKGKLFHHRCAAHIINLICKAGFEIINPIVHKIRESVKFIHGSTSRKQKFEEIIKQLGITYRRRPNIDIATRWNSTYLMLEICLELKRAFESLAQQDPEYAYAPSLQEWDKAKVVSGFLKTFYDATKVISGSLYPTANLFFHEIWEIKIALDNGVPEENAELSETIEYMQRKFRRYWKLAWLQISFPVIFDPRFKFELLEFRLKKAFGSEGESKVALLKKVLLDLFKDYSQVSPGNQDAAQQIATAEVVTNASGRYADWDQHLSENASSTTEVPSELDTYLKKGLIPRTETLDILSWWKSNSVEYPTLSRMARDVLAVPASTVASESAFSTGRRIISDLRSRLTPKNVEALICLQDWIRASGSSQFQMEGIEDFIELPDQHEYA
ncbi:unnamed protein product [Urochloa decumbens]|uniref:Transposase n=1 Tax=Urochloa decumbens TaxID=240449 RepID=A0ABC9BIL4_9POAL